ncbi:hypothetical protein GUITHDRAFT_150857 [Guillardia theta CCMP2712]|uniref:Uncharacterized protein n=1 Tax=Guillardia theta (strain CCMP2712) TaxID=905079 RepID=L1JU48_GUITC|nr:hypothetical protein GUITHDRAFT_150857 [Guillardia theta CCMP2712]EKX51942.1 hypothetical protein GUITHDRAFT_150857 [Guillardia theta CCMP2712]|eukprot:XP_005838922.1 hypothetical protein GUITHDRAFT_150857 [Guillardia theta CCMP2712]
MASVSSSGESFWKVEELVSSLTRIFTPSNEPDASTKTRESEAQQSEPPALPSGSPPEDEEQGGEEESPVIYFACYTLQGHKRVIPICEDQTYQDFLDFVENEFGSKFWPSLVEQASGFRKYVLHDNDFAWLCEYAQLNGGYADIQLEVTPVMWPDEYEEYSKLFKLEGGMEGKGGKRRLH